MARADLNDQTKKSKPDQFHAAARSSPRITKGIIGQAPKGGDIE